MNPSELPLRDIHLPAPPGWWPLAPGWWLVIALLVMSLVAALAWWRWRRRQIDHRVSRRAAEIQAQWRRSGDHRACLVAFAELLRRAAIASAGRERAASLTGARWRAWLNAPLPGAPFDERPASLLLDAHYQPESPALSPDDVQALANTCQAWARAVTRRSHAE